MASVLKIKRSAVSGKAPTTSDIQPGEIALNINDGKLYSTDGIRVFEVGANVASLSINDEFALPTTDGLTGQVLKTDGNGNAYWDSAGVGAGTFQFYKNVGTVNLEADGIAVTGGEFPFYKQDGTLDPVPVA